MQNSALTVIGEDLVIEGEIKGGAQVEVRGRVDGRIDSAHVVIHSGGRVNGTVLADNADVSGTLNGTARVKNLISIGSTGAVQGDVRYGRIALAQGGELSADVRNVPPEITGDFQIAVRRGRSVPLTTADLSAFDPDDTASQLQFTVSNPVGGFIARTSAASARIDRFTQAELTSGGIVFVHDGSPSTSSSFDVVVSDRAGGSSGTPRTVQVAVI